MDKQLEKLMIQQLERLAESLAVQGNEMIDLQDDSSELLPIKCALLEHRLDELSSLANACESLSNTFNGCNEAWVMLDDGVGRKLAELKEREAI
jgi:hypothetical protein